LDRIFKFELNEIFVYGNILMETFWSIMMNLWRYEVNDDMVDTELFW